MKKNLTVTDVVYQGGGFIATFDDNSQASGITVVRNGRQTIIGLNQRQLAAWNRFTDDVDSDDEVFADPRFTDPDDVGGGGGGGSTLQHFFVSDTKDPNVTMGGGFFLGGAWRTRDLNTVEVNEIPGASLGVNQFTLPAGKYNIRSYAVARAIQGHRSRLYNVTDSEATAYSLDQHLSSSGHADPSRIDSIFEIDSPKTFEIQHWPEQDGSGSATTFGVYAVVPLRDENPSVPFIVTIVAITKVG